MLVRARSSMSRLTCLRACFASMPRKGKRERGERASLLRNYVSHYANLCEKNPCTSSFAVTSLKSGLSDTFAQKIVEQKDKMDLKRTLVFATFGGWYAGWFQHFIYNRIYPRVFGIGRTFWPVFSKIMADNLIHMPFLVLPCYFWWQMMLLPESGGIRLDGTNLFHDVIERWQKDAWALSVAFWKIWTPAHIVTFGFMPEPLRITWVAAVSFFWLIIKSVMAHTSYEHAVLQKKQEG